MLENWNLFSGKPGEFYFSELIHKSNSLTIILKKIDSNDEFLKIKFSGILTYKFSIESARTKTIYEHELFGLLNRTSNSKYLSWFKDESGGLFNSMELAHVMICSYDAIIDTITNEVPEVSWCKI